MTQAFFQMGDTRRARQHCIQLARHPEFERVFGRHAALAPNGTSRLLKVSKPVYALDGPCPRS